VLHLIHCAGLYISVLLEVGVTTQTRVLYILPVGHEDPVEKAECIVYIQY